MLGNQIRQVSRRRAVLAQPTGLQDFIAVDIHFDVYFHFQLPSKVYVA